MRILIADDDIDFTNRITKELSEEYGVEAVVAHDGAQALELMTSALFDAAVLDVVMPVLDGVTVMHMFERIPVSKQPVIIFATYPGLTPATRCDCASLDKPFDANDIMEVYNNEYGLRVSYVKERYNKPISTALKGLGLTPLYMGYRFLCDAIVYAYLDACATDDITRNIYEPIAQVSNNKAVNIERCIRHAIESAWSRSTPDIIESVFGNTLRADTGKPTNAQFIALLADRLRMGEAQRA